MDWLCYQPPGFSNKVVFCLLEFCEPRIDKGGVSICKFPAVSESGFYC